MKCLSVTLEREEAIFSWKEGRVYCEGYDLESEKIALALTGYGEGVGVLLVAINTACKSEAEFRSEVKMFVAGYKKIGFGQCYEWPKGQLLFEYCSYSSNLNIRWGGLYYARLSEQHYNKMLKDPDMGITIWMARLKQLPEKYFYQLLNLSLWGINCELALNKNCPIDILEILAQDKDEWVRQNVAKNPNCPQKILESLAQDKSL